MKTRNLVVLALFAVFIAVWNSGCIGCDRITPGHVGLKINMSGSYRGVDDLPLQTGWVFYNTLTTQVFEYPTFVQTASWTRDVKEGHPTNEEISFNSKEGLIITGDISISYQIKSEAIPKFYVKFRSDDLDTFTHGYLRNVARDAFNEIGGHYSIEGIYGPQKEEFLVEVRKRIGENVQNIGVALEQLGFIGAPRPPENVIRALNDKVGATQAAMQSENELRRAEAEAKKKVATAEGDAKSRVIRATADAEANKIVAASITPELVKYLAVTKWDGALPRVAGSSIPMVQLPDGK